MSQPTLDQRTGSTTPDAFAALVASLPGKVVLPGDPTWDVNRLGWVVSVDQQPSAVVMCANADDVVTAVRFAASRGCAVAAQPVGHGATVAVNGTILLRTRGLREIHVDAEARVARVGAGVK